MTRSHQPPKTKQPAVRGKALWARLAAQYDWLVQRLVPHADAFFDTCISFIPKGPIAVLELGSGTGYATEMILKHNPKAKITSLDMSEEMLAAAKTKKALRGVELIQRDIRDEWPAGRYDVILSTLCLHHLSRPDRKTTHQRIYAALKRNGRLINGDIFKPTTRWEETLIRDRWLASLRKGGLPKREAEQMIAKRRANMRCFDTLDEYRESLSTAGFRRTVCPWTSEMAAIWVGFKGKTAM